MFAIRQVLSVPAVLGGGPQTPVGRRSSDSSRHAAIVQDLTRRQSLTCPAHPAHQAPASFGGSLQREATADLELTFAGPAFEPAICLAPKPICGTEHSAGAAAHIVHALCKSKNSTSAQARRSQLQESLPGINFTALVTKDPLLLTYCPATLRQHLQQLESLLGKDTACAMVTKMPSLLHFRASTVCHKLDDLYDLLPNADISKVQHHTMQTLTGSTNSQTQRPSQSSLSQHDQLAQITSHQVHAIHGQRIRA